MVIASQTGVSGQLGAGKECVGRRAGGDCRHMCAIEEGAILGAQSGIPSKKVIRGGGSGVLGNPGASDQGGAEGIGDRIAIGERNADEHGQVTTHDFYKKSEGKTVVAIVVVGGHSRNVGKTSVVAGLIAAMPEREWLAVKITQYGHGICSANGEACDCVTADHASAITEERDRSGETDTSRFLVAGAKRSLWVRTRQGFLAEAMPRLRERIAGAENVIIESNSVMKFLRPDLYLPVLDLGTADFKDSRRNFLDLASAVVVHRGESESPAWEGVSLKPVAGKPMFRIEPPEYVTPGDGGVCEREDSDR